MVNRTLRDRGTKRRWVMGVLVVFGVLAFTALPARNASPATADPTGPNA